MVTAVVEVGSAVIVPPNAPLITSENVGAVPSLVIVPRKSPAALRVRPLLLPALPEPAILMAEAASPVMAESTTIGRKSPLPLAVPNWNVNVEPGMMSNVPVRVNTDLSCDWAIVPASLTTNGEMVTLRLPPFAPRLSMIVPPASVRDRPVKAMSGSVAGMRKPVPVPTMKSEFSKSETVVVAVAPCVVDHPTVPLTLPVNDDAPAASVPTL